MADHDDAGGLALSLEGVTKRYPGTLAVDGVDFSVRSGEIHALIGENGAGKSTLVKIIAGAFDDYEGTVRINGRAVALHSPRAAKANGIEMIHQELSLAPPLSVAENVLAGRLPTRAGVFVDRRRMLADARQRIAQVGLSLDPAKHVADLSPHEAQLVEIARALGNAPCILVLDEPTSSLSREEVDRLFATLGRLRSMGLAIVYISHHLPEVFRIADRVTVLRDGRRISTERLADVTPERLVALMVGRDAGGLEARCPRGRGARGTAGPGRFAVSGAGRHGFFRDVSFEVHGGEIVGVGGLSGSGRTELARSLCGIDPLHTGRVRLDGRDITPRSCSAAIEAGLAYVTEDRKADGLALRLPVIDNVLAALRPGRNEPLPHHAAGARKAAGLADRLDLQPRRLDRDVASLSGGNQQKALLAKWLATEPDVLFLDEPTRGVDVGAKLAIHRAIERLADQGRCVVLISSDLPELVGLSDRVLIMREGRLAREIAGDACSEEGVLMAAYGHEPQLRSEAAAADPGPAPPASPQCADGAHGTTSPDEIGRATGARAWAIRLALVLALIVAARVVAPQFMSADNLLTVLQTVALLGIVSCGVCFVTYSGHYADLSAPSTMALAGIVSVSVLGHGIVAALAAGLAAGLAVGLVNGVAIGRLRVNPIIWTLATGAGVGGLIRWAYSGTQVYPDAGTAAGRAFLGLYGIRLFGTVPVSVVVLGVVAAAAAVLLSRTRFGFHARLTGGAYEAARLSGVNTSVVVERAFLLSGAAAAIGGMLLTSLNKVGAPYVGQGYDFAAVTAVVLGGVGLAGGRGTVPGVLGGVMVIGVLRNVMNLLGWGAFHQDIAQGIVFIVVVGCASALARRKGRADA